MQMSRSKTRRCSGMLQMAIVMSLCLLPYRWATSLDIHAQKLILSHLLCEFWFCSMSICCCEIQIASVQSCVISCFVLLFHHACWTFQRIPSIVFFLTPSRAIPQIHHSELVNCCCHIVRLCNQSSSIPTSPWALHSSCCFGNQSLQSSKHNNKSRQNKWKKEPHSHLQLQPYSMDDKWATPFLKPRPVKVQIAAVKTIFQFGDVWQLSIGNSICFWFSEWARLHAIAQSILFKIDVSFNENDRGNTATAANDEAWGKTSDSKSRAWLLPLVSMHCKCFLLFL